MSHLINAHICSFSRAMFIYDVKLGFSAQTLFANQLDGVGPVDNRPSTNNLHHFVKKKKMTCDTWHVTRDKWHVTRDTWHITHDTWHVTCDTFGGGVNVLSKFQLPSSYYLWFMILRRSGGKGWLTCWINDKAVYRTAPAAPGLLIINRPGVAGDVLQTAL